MSEERRYRDEPLHDRQPQKYGAPYITSHGSEPMRRIFPFVVMGWQYRGVEGEHILHSGYNELVKLYRWCQASSVRRRTDLGLRTWDVPPAKKMRKPIAKSFRATLECLKSGVNWIIIRVPLDVPLVGRPRPRGGRGTLSHRGRAEL